MGVDRLLRALEESSGGSAPAAAGSSALASAVVKLRDHLKHASRVAPKVGIDAEHHPYAPNDIDQHVQQVPARARTPAQRSAAAARQFTGNSHLHSYRKRYGSAMVGKWPGLPRNELLTPNAHRIKINRTKHTHQIQRAAPSLLTALYSERYQVRKDMGTPTIATIPAMSQRLTFFVPPIQLHMHGWP